MHGSYIVRCYDIGFCSPRGDGNQKKKIPRSLFFASCSTIPVDLSLSSSRRRSSSEGAQSNVRSDRTRDGVHENVVVASMLVSEFVTALHEDDGHDGRLEQARDDE